MGKDFYKTGHVMFDWLFRRKKPENITAGAEASEPEKEAAAAAEPETEEAAAAAEAETAEEAPESETEVAEATEPETAEETPESETEAAAAAEPGPETGDVPAEEPEEGLQMHLTLPAQFTDPAEPKPEEKTDPQPEPKEKLDPQPEQETEAGEQPAGKKKKNKDGRKGKTHNKKKSLYDRHTANGKKRGHSEAGSRNRTVTVRSLTLGEGLPAICVPLTGCGREELREQAAEAVRFHPDMTEWRADAFARLEDTQEAEAALRELREILGDIPLLLTIRTEPEGGGLPFDPEEYEGLIRWAARQEEADLIDLEVMHMDVDAEALCADIHACGKRVVASAHFFSHTPRKEELRQVFVREERCGADLLKVAAMPRKEKDVLRLMQASQQYHEETGAVLITMSMGELGRISRISGRLTGSAVTFGTAGAASAPGQLPVEALRSALELV